jgi:hypothetical protein
MDWNPSYSYSTLPEGYSYDSIPEHWKIMLKKVSPEQGTPHFRNVHMWNMRGTVRGAAISIQGMKESPIENYFLSDIDVEARTPGDINFAKGWKFNNVTLKTSSPGVLKIQNSTDMQIDLIDKR